jgi:hypothetical protein
LQVGYVSEQLSGGFCHLTGGVEARPAFVDTFTATAGSNGLGTAFIVPSPWAAVPYVNITSGDTSGDEVDWATVAANLQIVLHRDSATPNQYKTKWVNSLGHNLGVRVVWRFT